MVTGKAGTDRGFSILPHLKSSRCNFTGILHCLVPRYVLGVSYSRFGFGLVYEFEDFNLCDARQGSLSNEVILPLQGHNVLQ